MATLDPINDPDLNPSPYRHRTFKASLNSGEDQIVFMPPQVGGFKPATIVMSDKDDVTIELTADSVEDIKDDAATWVTVTPTENMYVLASVVTAVRLTASATASVKIAC